MNIADRRKYAALKLTDTEARIIAAWWQDGRLIGLASLQSTGAVLPPVFTELSDNIRDLTTPGADPALGDLGALYALAIYCALHRDRAPVDGWSARTGWSSADEQALRERLHVVAEHR